MPVCLFFGVTIDSVGSVDPVGPVGVAISLPVGVTVRAVRNSCGRRGPNPRAPLALKIVRRVQVGLAELGGLGPGETKLSTFHSGCQAINGVEGEAVHVVAVLSDHASAAEDVQHLQLVGREALLDLSQVVVDRLIVACLGVGAELPELVYDGLLLLWANVGEGLETELNRVGDLRLRELAIVMGIDSALDDYRGTIKSKPGLVMSGGRLYLRQGNLPGRNKSKARWKPSSSKS